MLSRMPSSTLADLNLQKGDAVYVLATEGTATTPKTAITLLSGVEPILQASPSASQAMMLTPWSRIAVGVFVTLRFAIIRG